MMYQINWEKLLEPNSLKSSRWQGMSSSSRHHHTLHSAQTWKLVNIASWVQLKIFLICFLSRSSFRWIVMSKLMVFFPLKFPLKFLKYFATDFSAICFLLIKLGNFGFYKTKLFELKYFLAIMYMTPFWPGGSEALSCMVQHSSCVEQIAFFM